jgi:protein TonB
VRVAGIAVSALGHGALIALALVAPPWLRPHHEAPVQAIEISMISETQYAAALALARGSVDAAPADPAPVPEPAAPVVEPAPPPETEPVAAPEDEALPSLTPFDPEAPLGLGRQAGLESGLAGSPRPAELVSDLARRAAEAVAAGPAAAPASTVLERVSLPPKRPPRMPTRRAGDPPASAGSAGAAPETQSGGAADAGATLRAGYGEAVRQAIAAAQVYPTVARDRGIEGKARLIVVVGRDGRLVNARLVRSSGFGALDSATLAAARNARLPAPPPTLPDPRFSFEMEMVFTLDGG